MLPQDVLVRMRDSVVGAFKPDFLEKTSDSADLCARPPSGLPSCRPFPPLWLWELVNLPQPALPGRGAGGGTRMRACSMFACKGKSWCHTCHVRPELAQGRQRSAREPCGAPATALVHHRASRVQQSSMLSWLPDVMQVRPVLDRDHAGVRDGCDGQLCVVRVVPPRARRRRRQRGAGLVL